MRDEPFPVMDILPDEQQEVFLEYGLDVCVPDFLADVSGMFVIARAGGLVELFPAAFPRNVPEVGIFKIEGRERGVDPAEFQKLFAIEGARPAATVETRVKILNSG